MTKREIVAWGIAGLSCACAIGTYISHRRTASLLKKTVKELAEATPVEIEKDIVDQVVQEALEMKVDSQVDDILKEAQKEMSQHIDKEVKQAVKKTLNDTMAEHVSQRFLDEVEELAADDIKDLVAHNAASMIERKIDVQLDDIYKRYQDRLDQYNNLLMKTLANAGRSSVTLAPNVTPGLSFSLSTDRR